MRHAVLLLLSSALGLAGCGTGGPRRSSPAEWLDERSGVSVTVDPEAIVFARTETRYSLTGRDYLFLGPIETNRQGTRDYYLWVGVGTTLDRGYIAPKEDTPSKLYVEIHGELMELDLKPWSEREPRLAATRVYRPTVPLETELAARVTLEQLTLLAQEPLVAVHTAQSGGRERTYYRWDSDVPWQSFFATLAGGPR